MFLEYYKVWPRRFSVSRLQKAAIDGFESWGFQEHTLTARFNKNCSMCLSIDFQQRPRIQLNWHFGHRLSLHNHIHILNSLDYWINFSHTLSHAFNFSRNGRIGIRIMVIVTTKVAMEFSCLRVLLHGCACSLLLSPGSNEFFLFIISFESRVLLFEIALEDNRGEAKECFGKETKNVRRRSGGHVSRRK